MTRTRLAQVVGVALAAVVLGTLTPAAAQFRPFGMQLEGEIEAGVQGFIAEPTENRKTKLEEYRDVPEGPFLRQLRLRIFRPDSAYSTELTGSKWGQDDQEFGLTTGRLGLWELGLSWDQIPHVYASKARTLATEERRGVYTLPDALQTTGSLNAHNAAPEHEISQRWDTARISLVLTPTPELDFRAEYTRTSKDGGRPYSLAFGSPGGNFYEVPEPIDQTQQELRLRGTLMRETWQLQGGYTFSVFRNSVRSLIVDNPVAAAFGAFAPSLGGGGGSSTPAVGQMSLAPDNMAHSVNLAGGVTLPFWRTRLTGNAGYSARLQTDAFLPHTINPVLAGAGGSALDTPHDLDGYVGIFNLNLSAVTRPLRAVAVTAKYRLFDYDDRSKEIRFPGHVVNDQSLVLEERRAGRWPYTRQNADLDVRWQFIRMAAVTVGGGWERWDRGQHREVPTSDEVSGKLALDATPLDWLSVRLAYRPSFRRIDEYNTFAHLAHAVVEEETAAALSMSQSVSLRKYDEGERDRHKLTATLMLSPIDTLSATVSGEYRVDDYVGGHFGLRNATVWSTGVDVGWSPFERFSIAAGYMHEEWDQRVRGRSRPVRTVGGVSAAVDFTSFDWLSDSLDVIDTFYASAKVTLIPKKLDWTAAFNYSLAVGRVDTRNPIGPTEGTASENTTATAKAFPAMQDTLIRLETALSYHFARAWTVSLGYIFESFQKNDWHTEHLNPFMPNTSGNAIWLGIDNRNYAAHIVGMTLGYRFQ